ncbi:hypothetical protein GOB83_13680 [Acetobacter fabarum]|uniref:hypothetical protein n=1 Tax=Acetobacter fabarum TaxID=483199 RepID=UPI0014055BE2|nr:hypothetical protein [Acetobacter fabarum]NHO43205.1 hypothetical protein [Acetobacter fabarum]
MSAVENFNRPSDEYKPNFVLISGEKIIPVRVSEFGNALYILDRNSINRIRNYIETGNLTSEVQDIQKYDCVGNTISMMNSFLEGNYKDESYEKIKKQTNIHSKVISIFFKYAETDVKFFNENFEKFFVHESLREKNFLGMINFLKEVSCLLYRDYNMVESKGILEKILKKAINYSIPASNPVVIVCIASLYGNRDAKGVIKPKMDVNQFNPYSALNDLLSIIRAFRMQAFGRKFGIFNSKIDNIVTYDSCLNNIIKYFSYSSPEKLEIGASFFDLHININIKGEMFTNIFNIKEEKSRERYFNYLYDKIKSSI